MFERGQEYRGSNATGKSRASQDWEEPGVTE
jgi:hypothetical protein